MVVEVIDSILPSTMKKLIWMKCRVISNRELILSSSIAMIQRKLQDLFPSLIVMASPSWLVFTPILAASAK